MGFGLLFIGYFIAFLTSVNNYGFAFRIVGYAIMFSAIGKLSEYKHKLSRTTIPLFLLAVCALFDAGKTLAELLTIKMALFSETNALWVSLASVLLSVAFQTLLLLGIREIGKDAEADGIPTRAVWCTVIVWIVGILEVALSALGTVPAIGESNGFRILTLLAALARILYPVAILAFLFSCYAKICAPEDTDMAPRPSRFAFVNRLREEREKKAAEVMRLRDEYQQKLEQKDTPTKNKRSKKNKKK